MVSHPLTKEDNFVKNLKILATFQQHHLQIYSNQIEAANILESILHFFDKKNAVWTANQT